MTNSTTSGPSRAQREADARAARRAEQANIVAGLQSALESHEQLLAFARGRIGGGVRGKLNIGPEAFFAPYVNIGLTERRLVLQHIRHENGRPADILPHYFVLSEIASVTFADIETYGGDPACRLIVRLTNDLYCRLRLRGALNFENAQALAEVFSSLTASHRSATTPTQRTCAQCSQTLDQPYRFCPYCGTAQPETAFAPNVTTESPAAPETTGFETPEKTASDVPTAEAAAPADEAPAKPDELAELVELVELTELAELAELTESDELVASETWTVEEQETREPIVINESETGEQHESQDDVIEPPREAASEDALAPPTAPEQGENTDDDRDRPY